MKMARAEDVGMARLDQPAQGRQLRQDEKEAAKSWTKNFWGVLMKYSYNQRLLIVSRVKQGESISHLSKECHINKTQILAWVRMWDKYDRSGLEQQPPCRPTVKLQGRSSTFNIGKGVPLSPVRVEYRISKTALQRWGSAVRK